MYCIFFLGEYSLKICKTALTFCIFDTKRSLTLCLLIRSFSPHFRSAFSILDISSSFFFFHALSECAKISCPQVQIQHVHTVEATQNIWLMWNYWNHNTDAKLNIQLCNVMKMQKNKKIFYPENRTNITLLPCNCRRSKCLPVKQW